MGNAERDGSAEAAGRRVFSFAFRNQKAAKISIRRAA